MGVMDTTKPFGLKLIMLRLAKSMLTCSISKKQISLTSEAEIQQAVEESVYYAKRTSEVCGNGVDFEQANIIGKYASMLIKSQNMNATVIPIPNHISSFILKVLKTTAPLNLSLTQGQTHYQNIEIDYIILTCW